MRFFTVCSLLFGLAACSSTVSASITASQSALESEAATAGDVHITVTQVAVHLAQDGNESKSEEFITVFEGSEELNLSDLVATEAFLDAGQVPAGKVTQIRLIISEAFFDDGINKFPIECPSCTETGIKLNPSGKLEVPEGGNLDLTLDFDLDASLSGTTDSLRLDPVIKISGNQPDEPTE